MTARSITLWIIRVTAALLLIIGVVIWPGNADSLILPHMALGFVFSAVLLVLAYQGLRARISPVLVVLTAVWAVALPVLGLTQGGFPDALEMPIQVFHLLLGVGAWVLAEVLVRRLPK